MSPQFQSLSSSGLCVGCKRDAFVVNDYAFGVVFHRESSGCTKEGSTPINSESLRTDQDSTSPCKEMDVLKDTIFRYLYRPPLRLQNVSPHQCTPLFSSGLQGNGEKVFDSFVTPYHLSITWCWVACRFPVTNPMFCHCISLSPHLNMTSQLKGIVMKFSRCLPVPSLNSVKTSLNREPDIDLSIPKWVLKVLVGTALTRAFFREFSWHNLCALLVLFPLYPTKGRSNKLVLNSHTQTDNYLGHSNYLFSLRSTRVQTTTEGRNYWPTAPI